MKTQLILYFLNHLRTLCPILKLQVKHITEIGLAVSDMLIDNVLFFINRHSSYGFFIFFLLLGFLLSSGSPEFTLCDDVGSGPPSPAGSWTDISVTKAFVGGSVAGGLAVYLLIECSTLGLVTSACLGFLVVQIIITKKKTGDPRPFSEEPQGSIQGSPHYHDSEAEMPAPLKQLLNGGHQNQEGSGPFLERLATWLKDVLDIILNALKSMEVSPAFQELLNGNLQPFLEVVMKHPSITIYVVVVLLAPYNRYLRLASIVMALLKWGQVFCLATVSLSVSLWGLLTAATGAFIDFRELTHQFEASNSLTRECVPQAEAALDRGRRDFYKPKGSD